MCGERDEGGEGCGRVDCRNWIDCPDSQNCVRNVERVYTMKEIVNALHVSQPTAYREMERAVGKLILGLRKAMVDSSLGDRWETRERKRKPGAE